MAVADGPRRGREAARRRPRPRAAAAGAQRLPLPRPGRRRGPRPDVSFSYRATFAPDTVASTPTARTSWRACRATGRPTTGRPPPSSPAASGACCSSKSGRGRSRRTATCSTRSAGRRSASTRSPPRPSPADKGDLGVFLSNYDCVVLANVPADAFAGRTRWRRSATPSRPGLRPRHGRRPGQLRPRRLPEDADRGRRCRWTARSRSLKARARAGWSSSCTPREMADGNIWQKEIAKLAIERLGPADKVGVARTSAGDVQLAHPVAGGRHGHGAGFLRQIDQHGARRHAGLRPVPADGRRRR